MSKSVWMNTAVIWNKYINKYTVAGSLMRKCLAANAHLGMWIIRFGDIVAVSLE